MSCSLCSGVFPALCAPEGEHWPDDTEVTCGVGLGLAGLGLQEQKMHEILTMMHYF